MNPTPTKNNLPWRQGDFTNLAEALDYAAVESIAERQPEVRTGDALAISVPATDGKNKDYLKRIGGTQTIRVGGVNPNLAFL